jgi:hypothetical protein
VAALECRLTAALGGVAARTLSAAEMAFSDALGPPVAGRLTHLPTIRELLWVLARLDRYCTFSGEPQPGAGLDILQGKLERVAGEVAWGERPAAPRHLGYFVPELRLEARHWKHQTAPRVKDRRIREGRRPARRKAARPGGGPPVGRAPPPRPPGGRGQ